MPGDRRAAGRARSRRRRPCPRGGRRRTASCRRRAAPYRFSQMVEVRSVVAGLPRVALVARPAEVLDDRVGRVDDPVDLLPVVPADVADPELARPGPEREAERVAQAVGDDPARVRVGAAGERVAGRPAPVAGSTRMIEPSRRGRIAGRAQVLAAQRAALGGRRGQRRARRRPGGSPHGLSGLPSWP